MEPSGEQFSPVETQLPSQETLKSMFDLSSFIARKGILVDRQFYQAAGIVRSLDTSALIGLTVPGPKQRELTPNELEVNLDMMLVNKNKKGLHTIKYDIKKKKQGNSNTYTIERQQIREDLNLNKDEVKSMKRGNDFLVLSAQGHKYLSHLKERIKARKERRQAENDPAKSYVTSEEADELNEMLTIIKGGGFSFDLTKGYKAYQETGGEFVDI